MIGVIIAFVAWNFLSIILVKKGVIRLCETRDKQIENLQKQIDNLK